MPVETDYAIVIGINHYSSLKALNGPISDAKKFVGWLKDPEGGDLLPGNIHSVLSKEEPLRPVQDDIDDALAKIYQQGKDKTFRRLYFFFAGHGVGTRWNENGLCLPKYSELFRNSALSSSGYLGVIIESGLFKEVYFFLDCCRNRKISVQTLHPQIGWPKPGAGTADSASLVAYASRFDNAAFESDSWEESEFLTRGLFTKALLLGLKKGAINREGNITTHSLKSFLKTKVEELAKSIALTQTVRFEDSFTGEQVIKEMNLIVEVDAKIRFKKAGNIIVRGPALNEIKKGLVNAGDTWDLLLKKGEHMIINTTTDEKWNIFIDGTVNPFKYVCEY